MKFFIVCMLFVVSLGLSAQTPGATVSGSCKDSFTKTNLPFVNVTLLREKDTTLIAGTISNEQGRFSFPDIARGSYLLRCSYVGFKSYTQTVLVGQLNNFFDLGSIFLVADEKQLDSITVIANRENNSSRMDRKTFNVADNSTQSGGSVLDVMKNLPGVTTQDGRVQLRGSDKVMILVDGRQTALTGFGGQSSLENIPASAIDRIEIINNPSAKYDANGNAGIINIIYKKEKQQGFNGKIGFTGGAGALWIKRENYPGIRPQYQWTPKVNPSLSLNFRRQKINLFLQADNLFTKTLNKNEFADRYYESGDTVKQQTKRNRTTNIVTVRSGFDWFKDASNVITVSALFSSEKILDRGDEPFFDSNLKNRRRLWQFLEDELKTTITGTAYWQHKFQQPGRTLSANINYTFHREDEKYFFTNILPSYTGLDSFALLSDEHVLDVSLDYVQPLRYGRFESGIKFRRRWIPVNMDFKPGLNSPLDVKAGGAANYSETIPAVYGNYIFESRKFELEAGMRLEFVQVEYDVNADHPVYKSDRYDYQQPFGSLRLGYKLDENNKLSLFYNRRVDRPNEVDIRIFPKYDDAEIIKVGNPALRPQFTNSFEMGYKTGWNGGQLFTALYHKRMNATITRIGTITPNSTLIYNVFQNAGKSYSSGVELSLTQRFGKWINVVMNVNGYQNVIDAFTVTNLYPSPAIYQAAKEDIFSGNVKLTGTVRLPASTELQVVAIYQAPDLVPQAKTFSRFSVDLGAKKSIQKGKAELFVNATDVANTLQLKREVRGDGFKYISTDYYETQVFRLGYSYKF